MKKIFILTGEASGDRLASRVISNLKTLNADRYTGTGFDDKYLRDNVVVSIHTRNIGR